MSMHYIGLNRVPTKDTLLNLAYYEVINHLEYYGSFVNYEDSDLVQELEDYIRFKKYSSSTIDLVITVIANAYYAAKYCFFKKKKQDTNSNAVIMFYYQCGILKSHCSLSGFFGVESIMILL